MSGGEDLVRAELSNDTVQHFLESWINKVFSNGLSIVENESQIGGQIESSRQVSEKIEIKCVKWHFCHMCIYHFFCENKSIFFFSVICIF